MFPFLQRLEAKRYKQYIRVFLRQYQLAKTCPACGGARLKPEALAVTLGGRTIAGAAALTVAALRDWVAALDLPTFQRTVAVHILAELSARLSFVNDVGLGYLTLDRLTRTLPGGEARPQGCGTPARSRANTSRGKSASACPRRGGPRTPGSPCWARASTTSRGWTFASPLARSRW